MAVCEMLTADKSNHSAAGTLHPNYTYSTPKYTIRADRLTDGIVTGLY